MCECKLKRVARIQFLRSIRSLVLEKSTVSIKLIVCSEFNDPISDISESNSRFSITLSLIGSKSGDNAPITSQSSFILPITSCSSNSESSDLRFQLPPGAIGDGYLTISLLPTSSESRSCSCCISDSVVDGILVIPIISEVFTILPSDSSISGHRTLLGSYRKLNINCQGHNNPGDRDSVIVHEQYGATLGSHLYDSSIILLRYFEKQPLFDYDCDNSTKIIVELGAGCGLVGLWCSTVFNNAAVYLTDMICQKKIINHNIQVNKQETRCQFMELEWSGDKHISKLNETIESSYPSSSIDTLIATDVLYDRDASKLLFHAIRKLAKPGVTQVFIAQKLRQNTITDALHVDIRLEEDFQDVTNVYEEANVIVWKFVLSPNSL